MAALGGGKVWELPSTAKSPQQESARGAIEDADVEAELRTVISATEVPSSADAILERRSIFLRPFGNVHVLYVHSRHGGMPFPFLPTLH